MESCKSVSLLRPDASSVRLVAVVVVVEDEDAVEPREARASFASGFLTAGATLLSTALAAETANLEAEEDAAAAAAATTGGGLAFFNLLVTGSTTLDENSSNVVG